MSAPAVAQVTQDVTQAALFNLDALGASEPARKPTRSRSASQRAPFLVLAGRVQPGDLWQLGAHRLLCGDSLDADNAARLLAGAKPGVLLTDPPYGIRLDASYKRMNYHAAGATSLAGPSQGYAPVLGDSAAFDAAPIRQLYGSAREQFYFGADYYARSLGDTEHSGAWFVWDKRCSASAGRMFGSGFELIYSARKHQRTILYHRWAGFFGTENEPERRRLHPTQKPLALLRDILERWSKPGALVADPFAGVGSTLLACEQTGRVCYTAEIDPNYADIALARWEALTGNRAELLARTNAQHERRKAARA